MRSRLEFHLLSLSQSVSVRERRPRRATAWSGLEEEGFELYPPPAPECLGTPFGESSGRLLELDGGEGVNLHFQGD